MPQNDSSWGQYLFKYSVLNWIHQWRLCGTVSVYFKLAGNPFFLSWTMEELEELCSCFLALILRFFFSCFMSHTLLFIWEEIFTQPAPDLQQCNHKHLFYREEEPEGWWVRDSLPLQGQRLLTQLFSAGWRVCSVTSCWGKIRGGEGDDLYFQCHYSFSV